MTSLIKSNFVVPTFHCKTNIQFERNRKSAAAALSNGSRNVSSWPNLTKSEGVRFVGFIRERRLLALLSYIYVTTSSTRLKRITVYHT